MKKKPITSLQMVCIYACILLIIVVVITHFKPHHQSNESAPTVDELNVTREQDSINFRAIQSVERGQSDYTIPDSALKVH